MNQKYIMFAESSPGPKYMSKGWECQDKSVQSEFKDVQIIAVADGHGSSDCFRSEYGAEAATLAAQHVIGKYSKILRNSKETLNISESTIKKIIFLIWEKWKEIVENHWIQKGKPSEEELRYRDVSEKYKKRYCSNDEEIVKNYLYTAYGTTLLIAVSLPLYILIMQIGDGSCAVLHHDGLFSLPVPIEEVNQVNITTSLCENNAYLKFRHVIIDRNIKNSRSPIAVFLSTDGVDDCFPVYKNEEYLYKFYTNIIESIVTSGYKETFNELKNDTLPGLTSTASQDDISLAFFIDSNIEMVSEAFLNVKREHNR